ncbi:MAG: hypothetical protein QF792_03860, partial [Phycisphaerae bacterium]|nr:hypothetical protein [Phycisphaerae bacterium]
MKRKLVLLAGTFLAVLMVIGLWLLFSPPAPTYETVVDGDIPPVADPALTAARRGSVPDSREGYQLWSEERDPRTGRLKSIYRVRKWAKRDDGLYVLSDPSVILYQRDGKQVTIRSESGEVIAEEVAGRLRVKSGTLTGNVRVFLDRATDERQRKIPPEERPEVVRIYTDRIDFSNANQEIYTDSDVFLFSQEADICGRGLRLSWKDRPRELKVLEIQHGEIMIVHNAAGQRQMMLPGQGDSPAEQSSGQRSVIDKPKPPAPATAPGKTRKKKAPKESPKEKPASNIFVADFLAGQEDVRVDSGEGSLRGARKLSLIFHFDPSARQKRQPKATLPPPAQEDRPRPIDEPAPMPLEAADRSGRAAASRPAPSGPQTSPQRAGQPLIVRWDGPLILRPRGYTATPSVRKYSITAEGERVVLSDPHTTAICRKFTYQNADQVGLLSGAEGAPARLLLDNGQEIVCEAIEFDRRGNRAKLIGRGYMMRPARPAATAGASAAGISATTRPVATQPAGDRIEWSESVVAIFGREPVRGGDSPQGGRQFIKEATFVGDVQLTQYRTGDFVKCRQLHVWMARDDAGRSYPLKTIATDQAYARQRGSDILADEITVTFKPTGDESTGDLDGGVKPATLLAVGNVKITDLRGDEPVTAVADRLNSDWLRRTAVLTGRLARLTQGDNVLAGRRIRLWERKYLFRKSGYPDVVAARQFVRVDGAGELLFLTRRDLSGTALSEPRPIKITWKDGMEYHPKRVVGGIHPARGVAVFRGDVNVDSVMDHMSCGKMEVEFERAVAFEAPPIGEGDKTPDTGVV